ncbi:MAG TPA: T9SS type A sorting domain-containing protein [Chitinophagales bacterium]|nr:T9SS type A sorting domain-containing protein [Chitinophagales bacterium]
MKKLIPFFSIFIFFSVTAQVPQIEWQVCLGGTDYDQGNAVTQTADGGYAVVGGAISTNGNATGNHGGVDYLVVKLSSSGQVQWQKCLGGSGEDGGYGIDATPDGGVIVSGHAYSNDGDVSGNHGSSDTWIIKFDVSGNIQWSKCYGGTGGEEYPARVKTTSDGGYVFVTNSGSTDGDVNPPVAGQTDFWLVKLNSSGTIEWANTFGGSTSERPFDVEEAEDGGFIMAGVEYPGMGDYWWVVKADSNGNQQWAKTYGLPLPAQQAEDIEVVPGIGYIVVGQIDSAMNDGWVLLIDSSGNEIWDRHLSGSWYDNAVSVNVNDDGTYAVLGQTSSQNGDITCNTQSTDKFWWLTLDATGTTILNQFCFGGSGGDTPFMMRPTNDNGYICVGMTSSTDGDVSGNHGSEDFWVVKLGYNVGIEENEDPVASIFPNPSSTSFHLTAPTPNFTIQLFDVNGRRLIKEDFRNSREAEIDVSQMPCGIYPLQVLTDNGKMVWQKLVVGR